MLLTILGEYVQVSAGRATWQETLVSALGCLGYKTQTARQAVARSVSSGWLTTERHGRRARMTLTADIESTLRSGAERIYSFGEPWEWDGRWLLVALRIPEDHRDVRHQARTRLAWEGFGSLGGGLWISPHVERERLLSEIASNGNTAEMISFRAELGALTEPRRVISEAWDLATVADAYRDFIRRFSRLQPATAEVTFRAQTKLVHEWRKFPFLDPDLPKEHLPSRWPRSRAHELFVSRHEAWQEAAQQHFRELSQLGR
jgi:phenylacetic acid degradation operon negative regulatory protein